MKLYNQQIIQYPNELASVAASATIFASSASTSGSAIFSIVGSELMDKKTQLQMKSDLETELFEKIQFIEKSLININPEIKGCFQNFIREWSSLSTMEQKKRRLMDLRTDIYDKIFSYTCEKKGYKDAEWFKKQIFIGGNKIFNCIIFFILGDDNGQNLSILRKEEIQEIAKGLQNNYEKICEIGKKREKFKSDPFIETLMRETLFLLSNAINLRYLHYKSK